MDLMDFTITDEQKKKAAEWMAGRNPAAYSGTIGGRWTWSFTTTSLGTIVKVKDWMLDQAELDLTDYENW